MSNIVDLLVIGGGAAGLMTAKTAAQLGLKVILIEKNKNYEQIRRACSAQFILDDGYENEFLNLRMGKSYLQRINSKLTTLEISLMLECQLWHQEEPIMEIT